MFVFDSNILSEIPDYSSNLSVKGLLSIFVTLIFISSCSFPPTLSAEGATDPSTSKTEATTAEPKKPVEVVSPTQQPKTPNKVESPSQPKADDTKAQLDKFLGEMKPILEQASKVEAYLVGSEPAKPEVPEESRLGGYPVLSPPVTLKPEQVKAIQAIVLDGNSYFWGPPVKKCLLAPSAALRFIKGNKEVSILLSDYCDLWSFAYQNKLETIDYAPSASKVERLLTELFPKEFPAKP
jgi:hypothetical protein